MTRLSSEIEMGVDIMSSTLMQETVAYSDEHELSVLQDHRRVRKERFEFFQEPLH